MGVAISASFAKSFLLDISSVLPPSVDIKYYTQVLPLAPIQSFSELGMDAMCRQ